MATKAHMYDGVQWYQRPPVGITDADLEIRDGVGGSGTSLGTANRWVSMKASDDTLWVLVGLANTASSAKARLFAIKLDGTKYMVWLNWNYSGYISDNTSQPQLQETRDGTGILIKGNYVSYQSPVYVFAKSTFYSKAGAELDSGKVLAPADIITDKTFSVCNHISVYQDQYVWRTIGANVYLNSYQTPTTQYGTGGLYTSMNCACLLKDNKPNNGFIGGTYCVINGPYFQPLIYDGSSVSYPYLTPADISNAIVMLEDKWGDIVYMTNENPAKLYKARLSWSGTTPVYTAIGNITLTGMGQCYTFDTNADGDYFYSNAGGTWRIPANTEQGQAFSAIENHVKIRNVGMSTYNNSLTGYFPATKQ